MNAEAEGEPLKLLLVEDNDAHAEMVKRSFEQHKISNVIFHVDDGQKALARAAAAREHAEESQGGDHTE